MPYALGVGDEARVLCNCGLAVERAKTRELAIVAHGQHDVAVGRGKYLVGHDVDMRIAHALGGFSADQIIACLVRQHGHLRVEQ